MSNRGAATRLPLTPRESAFLKAYLGGPPGVRFVATQAVLAAGITKNAASAAVTGHQLLRSPKILRHLKDHATRSHTTAERAIQETVAHAYSRLDDVLEWDERGVVTCKPSSALSDAAKAAVESIKSTTRTRRVLRPDGAVEEHTTTRLEVKLVDKTPARRDLLRYHGLLKESAPPPLPPLLPPNFFAAVILGDPSKLELPARMPALGSAPPAIHVAAEEDRPP